MRITADGARGTPNNLLLLANTRSTLCNKIRLLSQKVPSSVSRLHRDQLLHSRRTILHRNDGWLSPRYEAKDAFKQSECMCCNVFAPFPARESLISFFLSSSLQLFAMNRAEWLQAMQGGLPTIVSRRGSERKGTFFPSISDYPAATGVYTS